MMLGMTAKKGDAWKCAFIAYVYIFIARFTYPVTKFNFILDPRAFGCWCVLLGFLLTSEISTGKYWSGMLLLKFFK